MKISYYLNQERKKNLYCRISDSAERVTFSLEYAVDPKDWNLRKEELTSENEHYFTLRQFKEYLDKRYLEMKIDAQTEILTRLKVEAMSFIKGDGINGIARKMFDYFHEEFDIPKYADFVAAFEKYSNLKKDEYKVETMDSSILFHTKNDVFIMDTYEGKAHELSKIINNRHYDELPIMTNINIWQEIYEDPGIEKCTFLPKLLNEWEIYWRDKYDDIKKTAGNVAHLDELKQESWRQFQAYMECFDSATDGIKLAYDINDFVLYPLAVFAMMRIYDAETCYNEYCEQEFYGYGDWESVSLNEEDNNSPIFHIKPYEL